ncbi:MAG: hypothetical protein AAFQ50_09525, partial [Pseudomonadota bacterium]
MSAGEDAPHVPVLLSPILDAVAPLRGTWIDGTMGAGGQRARRALRCGGPGAAGPIGRAGC